jgi:hypothetical protein
MPAGVRLVVRVTRRGYIGKYTQLRMRARRAPARIDRCLRRPDGRPVRCPVGWSGVPLSGAG